MASYHFLFAVNIHFLSYSVVVGTLEKLTKVFLIGKLFLLYLDSLVTK